MLPYVRSVPMVEYVLGMGFSCQNFSWAPTVPAIMGFLWFVPLLPFFRVHEITSSLACSEKFSLCQDTDGRELFG